MAKPNDTSNPEVTESSPASSRCYPPPRPTCVPRSATPVRGHPCTPTHLFDNAKVRLRSAINILAMTRLLDEKKSPAAPLAYINGALLSLLSDALSEIEAGHLEPVAPLPGATPRPGRGLCGIAHHKTFAPERHA